MTARTASRPPSSASPTTTASDSPDLAVASASRSRYSRESEKSSGSGITGSNPTSRKLPGSTIVPIRARAPIRTWCSHSGQTQRFRSSRL